MGCVDGRQEPGQVIKEGCSPSPAVLALPSPSVNGGWSGCLLKATVSQRVTGKQTICHCLHSAPLSSKFDPFTQISWSS